jgi:membrane protease YdiL (CAAX protease family)
MVSQRKKFDWIIVAFFVIAYALAWGSLPVLSLVAIASGIESGMALMAMAEEYEFDAVKQSLVIPPWAVYLITRITDFSFTISGLILMFATRGKSGIVDLSRRVVQWRVPARWYAVAVFPLLLYVLAAIVAARDPDVAGTLDLSPTAIVEALFGIGSGFMIYFLLRGAMGEEPGLRGFALDRLLGRHSPAKAAAIVGVWWVGWHIPVLLQKEILAVTVLSLVMFLLSFVFTWLYIGSKRSLLPVLILHASMNSSSSFEVILPGLRTTDWEIVSILGTLVISAVICGVLVRKSISASSKSAPPTHPGLV